MVTKKALGDEAEARAWAHLRGHGLTLVQRNYRVARGPRSRGGEVDLIVRERDVSHGGAAASIGPAKRSSLIFAAQHYLLRLPLLPPCRFDVVAIDGDHVQWLRAAFDVS